MKGAYYNEIDPETCAWLQNNMDAGLIAPGHIDCRSIKEVRVDDLAGYSQHHFFAGIGVYSYALRLAGWHDDRPIWTASCPCQPFSVAGKGAGFDDPRDLWPDQFRLVREFRPGIIMGEQTAGALGDDWLDRTCADLEGAHYEVGTCEVPACAVDAPNIRLRNIWIAEPENRGARRRRTMRRAAARRCGGAGRNGTRHSKSRRRDVGGLDVADASCGGNHVGNADAARQLECSRRVGKRRPHGELDLGDTAGGRLPQWALDYRDLGPAAWGRHVTGADDRRSWWADAERIHCHDGKIRRTQPGTPLLVNGLANRVLAWGGLGNAINAQLLKEVILAFMETRP